MEAALRSVLGPTPVKADSDKREYRLITLPNQLQVLLVAEPELKSAPPPPPVSEPSELDEKHAASTQASESKQTSRSDKSTPSSKSSSSSKSHYNFRARSSGKNAKKVQIPQVDDYDSEDDSDFDPDEIDNSGDDDSEDDNGSEDFDDEDDDEDDDDEDEMEIDDGDEDDDDEDDDDDDDDESDDDEDDDSDGDGKRGGGGAPSHKAAAAMCVNVGHWCDPADVAGLAHFCEHMLFFSNAKYPEENGWETYLSAHGGSSNASTDAEHTIYQFDVHPHYLNDALDRFAQFFISPLFSPDATEREILAVDSEFNISLQNDGHRVREVVCRSAQSSHPYSKFGWGNSKSLIHDLKAKGIDIREELLKFHSTYYSANAMKLVVLGSDLDELQKVVEERFGAILNSGRPPVSFAALGSPFGSESLGQVFEIASVREGFGVELVWSLPCLSPEYADKTADFLGNVIGHEGQGSLFARLKRAGWATSLYAGVANAGQEASSAAWIFTVTVTLTQEGYAHYEDVIGTIFCFLNLMRREGPQQYIWEEMKAVSEMEFRFQDKIDAVDYVEDLSLNLHFYKPEDIMMGDYVYRTYNPARITELLNLLTADRLRVSLTTKGCEARCDLVEPWFGAQYRRFPIPPHRLSEWLDTTRFDAELALPKPNEFVPTRFDLVSHPRAPELNLPEAGSPDALLPWCYPSPSKIFDEAHGVLWHKGDYLFAQPRTFWYFIFQSPAAYRQPSDAVLSTMLSMLLKDALNEFSYSATQAGLSFSLSAVRAGLDLKVSGFSDKLGRLLHAIVQRMAEFTPTAEQFAMQHELLMRYYTNMHFDVGKYGPFLRLILQQQIRFPIQLLRQAAAEITLADVTAYHRDFFSRVYVQAFAHGNISREETLVQYETIKDTLKWKPVPDALRYCERTLELPPCSALVFAQPGCNSEDKNSSVENFYQIGLETVKLRTTIEFLSHICWEPCFDFLRTKEQLGYSVSCSMRNTMGVLGFAVNVVSALHEPRFVDQRIEAFLTAFRDQLAKMSADEYAHHVEAFIADRTVPDYGLSDEASRLWDEIADTTLVFDRPAREAEVVRQLSQAELLAFYDEHIAPSPQSRRRKLSLQVFAAERALVSDQMLEAQAGRVGGDGARFEIQAAASASASSSSSSSASSSSLSSTTPISTLSATDLDATIPPAWIISGPAFALVPAESVDVRNGTGLGSTYNGLTRVIDWLKFKRSLPAFPDLYS